MQIPTTLYEKPTLIGDIPICERDDTIIKVDIPTETVDTPKDEVLLIEREGPNIKRDVGDVSKDDLLKDDRSTNVPLTDLIRHLQSLRQFKDSVQIPLTKSTPAEELKAELPADTVARLKKEIDFLQTTFSRIKDFRGQSLQYCLESNVLDEKERDRLRHLAVLEDKDAFILEGLEIGQSLRELKLQLDTLSTDPAFEKMDQIENQRTSLILEDLRKKIRPNLATESADTGGGFYEIYSTPDNQGDIDMLRTFCQTLERLERVESVVGVDSSLSFPYTDVTQALTQVTERLLLLDPKFLTEMTHKASDLSQKLNQMVKNRADLAEMSRVRSLYDLLDKWPEIQHTLPKLVNKIKYLSVLGTETNSLDTRLLELEHEVSQMSAILKDSEGSLNSLNEKIDEQINLLSKVCEQLPK